MQWKKIQNTEQTSDDSHLPVRGGKTESMIVSEGFGLGGLEMKVFFKSFSVILYL